MKLKEDNLNIKETKTAEQNSNSDTSCQLCFEAASGKTYDIILADPPWEQGKGGHKKVRPKSSGGGLDYPTMKLKDIESLLLRAFGEHGKDQLIIFVWTIDKYLTETDLMLSNMGFRRHARIIWDKITGQATAFTVRYCHEYLLWYYKGKFEPIEETQRGKYKTVQVEQVKRHSQKPEWSYEFINNIYPNKSKLELFARPLTPLFEKRDKWDVWGNEVKSDVLLSAAEQT